MIVIDINNIIEEIEKDTNLHASLLTKEKKENALGIYTYNSYKDTEAFINGIQNKLANFGIKGNIIDLAINTENSIELLRFNASKVNLIANPIPSELSDMTSLYIDFKKDIDCISFVNKGRIINSKKDNDDIIPSTIASICKIIDNSYKDLNGKHITILNASENIGRILSTVLIGKRATVTVCNSNTRDIKKHTLESDIVVSAIGKKGILDKSYFKDGQLIIDAGIYVENGKIYGDVDLESIKDLYVNICKNIGKINTTILVNRIIKKLR